MTEPGRKRAWSLPLLAAALFLAAGLGLAHTLHERESGEIRLRTAGVAADLERALAMSVHTRALALGRVASRWEEEGGLGERAFRGEVRRILADYRGFDSISFVDTRQVRRWIEPVEANRWLEGRIVPPEARRQEAMERARGSEAPAVSRPVRLDTGRGLGFHVWVPVGQGDAHEGFVAGIFLVQDFVDTVIEHFDGGLAGYAIRLRDGDEAIYGRLGVAGGGKADDVWRHTSRVALGGATWEMELTPLVETVEAGHTPLPGTVAVAAAGLAVLLGLAIRQGQLARFRLRLAERARERQVAEMAERERVTLALHRSEALYRTLAANLPDAAIFLFDTDLRYLLVEGPLLGQMGLGGVRLEGKALGERLPPDIAARLLPLYAGAVQGESSVLELQWAGRWYALAAVPVRNEAGEVYAGMMLAQDVTARRQARDELEALNERLARSNQELQDFAYIASHDLQEPLRKIQAFGDRLRSRYGEALGEQGQDYLSRMQDAASRMRDLIEGLLQFSRVTTNARPFERCDLGAVARQALADLEVRIEETGGVVELGALPTIDADPLQMRQLLQNLVGNALKFHQPGQPPRVRVSGTLVREGAGRVCELRVQDEGIGFDEKYLDRIFTVFQRLHGRGTYEGSGVGLAICRKIAHRHGGAITATSEPGVGTTFVVRLPAEQAPALPSAAA